VGRGLTGAIAVGVDSPTVARVDELAGSRGRVFPPERLAAKGLVIRFGPVGLDVHWTLARARGHGELFHPRAGPCNIKGRRLVIDTW
jgi:hypothetical protein